MNSKGAAFPEGNAAGATLGVGQLAPPDGVEEPVKGKEMKDHFAGCAAKASTSSSVTSDVDDDKDLFDKKRKMNIIYSRRKRLKKKLQIEDLQNSSSKLQQDNTLLRFENERLEQLLKVAQIGVAQIETQRRSGSSSLHSLDSGIMGVAMSPQLSRYYGMHSTASNHLARSLSAHQGQAAGTNPGGGFSANALGILPELNPLNHSGAERAGTLTGKMFADMGQSAEHRMLLHEQDQRNALLELAVQREVALQREERLRRELVCALSAADSFTRQGLGLGATTPAFATHHNVSIPLSQLSSSATMPRFEPSLHQVQQNATPVGSHLLQLLGLNSGSIQGESFSSGPGNTMVPPGWEGDTKAPPPSYKPR